MEQIRTEPGQTISGYDRRRCSSSAEWSAINPLRLVDITQFPRYFSLQICERLLIVIDVQHKSMDVYSIVMLNLSTSTEQPEIELGRSSLPSGYLSGINGAIIHPPSDPVKRPKIGLGLHLFNAAALLAGVGFGSDIRLVSTTQPMQFRR